MAVTTTFLSGNLLIAGDQEADDVAIVGTGIPGEISIVGRNGTVVDGVANGRTVVQGVVGTLSASLRDGDNVLNVDNVYLGLSLVIETWDGNDRVTFGETGVVSTASYCKVDLGGGPRDEFRALNSNVFIVEDLVVSTPAAFSAALIGASARGAIFVSGGLVSTNNILLSGVTAGAIVVTSPAAVNNVAIINSSAAFGNLEVNCLSGQNSIYIDACYSPLYIQARSFWEVPQGVGPYVPRPAPYNVDATITVARCLTPQIIVESGDNSLAVYAGGNDRVFLYANSVFARPNLGKPVDPIHVETAHGNDDVNVSYNVVSGDAFFDLGAGDDTLNFIANLIIGAAIAEGGAGTNRLRISFNQFSASAFTNFFEPSTPTLRPSR